MVWCSTPCVLCVQVAMNDPQFCATFDADLMWRGPVWVSMFAVSWLSPPPSHHHYLQ